MYIIYSTVGRSTADIYDQGKFACQGWIYRQWIEQPYFIQCKLQYNNYIYSRDCATIGNEALVPYTYICGQIDL